MRLCVGFVFSRPPAGDRRVCVYQETAAQWLGAGARAVNRCSKATMGAKLAQLLLCFSITLPFCITEKVKERRSRQRDAEFTDKVGLQPTFLFEEIFLKKCVKLLQVKKTKTNSGQSQGRGIVPARNILMSPSCAIQAKKVFKIVRPNLEDESTNLYKA